MDRAIARLLDDPSPVVRQAVAAYLAAQGSDAELFLRELAAGEGATAEAASHFLRELNLSDPAADFRAFIRSFNYELESGCLLLARTLSPGLEPAGCHRTLDSLAARCRDLIAEPSTARESCRLINRVLFHEWAFRSDSDPEALPDTLLIDRVLQRRKGAPIALACVYLLVAGRLGLDLAPVGLPGFFFARGESEGRLFFVDPAVNGRLRSREEALDLLRSRNLPAHPGDLGPTPVREVLCRCCRMLLGHFRSAGDADRARLFAGFIEEFDAAYARHER